MPDGVYGDLHYLKSHPQADVVAEAAERNPNRLGLSHHAEGAVRMDGASVVVESVDKVYSVDLVQTPATNAGLFESEGKRMTIREAAEMAGEEKVLAAEGMGEYADKPMRENEGDYFSAMVSEVLASGADRSEKMKKIAAILKAQEMLTAEAPSAPAAPEGEMEEQAGEEVKKMAESVAQIMGKLDSLVESVSSIKAEHDARKLLESAGRDVTPERLAALQAVPADKRAALLESWPAGQRGARPAASPPAANATKYPTDTRQFLAAIRSN
jgi:predicted regulator of Ras-like GTPase activity (Roadblock/LC7/MglB family)